MGLERTPLSSSFDWIGWYVSWTVATVVAVHYGAQLLERSCQEWAAHANPSALALALAPPRRQEYADLFRTNSQYLSATGRALLENPHPQAIATALRVMQVAAHDDQWRRTAIDVYFAELCREGKAPHDVERLRSVADALAVADGEIIIAIFERNSRSAAVDALLASRDVDMRTMFNDLSADEITRVLSAVCASTAAQCRRFLRTMRADECSTENGKVDREVVRGYLRAIRLRIEADEIHKRARIERQRADAAARKDGERTAKRKKTGDD
jgi:hypothetical protein